MGQYLSQPSTEKESREGHADSVAYGLAAMQGWRVSMEDAHIAELDLDPATKTSLFAVFDGHGGRAVSQFCAAHLAEELVRTEAYRRGDLATAITQAYFRLDELLDSEEGKAELRKYVSDSKPKQPAGLFTDVETKLSEHTGAAEGQPHHASSDDATEPLTAAAGGAAEGSAEQGGLPGSSSNDREAVAERAMKKLGSSKDFLESHLMRASVLTPLDDEDGGGTVASSSGTQPSPPPPQHPHHARLSPIESGCVALAEDCRPQGQAAAAGGVPNGGRESEEEEEEDEQHHAAGMGATAVSVVVRGNKVVVANTGDSRCVLSKRGQARALTLDHKPILFEEAKRIIKAGGFVRDNRINGALNVSRTLGDLDFKRNADLPATEQMVVATPDIEQFTLEDGDEFLILACDGIWDVLTNQEAVDFVRKRLKAGESLKAICEQMCDSCLAPDLKGLCRGADNMSVVVVLFKRTAKLGGFWSSLLAACGRSPAYRRAASSNEKHSR